MRSRFPLLALAATCAAVIPAGPAFAGKSSKPTAPADTTAPAVTIASPSGGSTVGGVLTMTGTSSDNVSVAKVEVSVDGGTYQLASGTSSWSAGINTGSYADGTHTLAARATDKSGNASVKTITVTVSNAPAATPTPTPTATPSPTPTPDTTAPSVAITSPSAASTLTGTVNVAGTASDDVGLSKVEVAVDGAAWNLASGTSSWSWAWNTTSVADGQHTITARATDTSGNTTVTQQADAVQNTTSGTTTPPAGYKDQLITPEGVNILIASDVTGWTAQQIYDLLKPNAYELSLIGPALRIKVQTTSASSTSASASQTNGAYSGYSATMYLQAKAGSAFSYHPESIITHEYGHAWSLYHLYMTQNGNWSSYLSARGIAGDPRVDSTYNWSKTEMIADDYRMLFGTDAAIAGMAYMNPDAGDPRQVAGLKTFLASSW